MTHEELELLNDIHDFTTLFYMIWRSESSRRFIKTENIKCDLCIILLSLYLARHRQLPSNRQLSMKRVVKGFNEFPFFRHSR